MYIRVHRYGQNKISFTQVMIVENIIQNLSQFLNAVFLTFFISIFLTYLFEFVFEVPSLFLNIISVTNLTGALKKKIWALILKEYQRFSACLTFSIFYFFSKYFAQGYLQLETLTGNLFQSPATFNTLTFYVLFMSL